MNIEELERLEKQATPGPWAMRSGSSTLPPRIYVEAPTKSGAWLTAEAAGRGQANSDNGELIAAIRNAAPQLIAIAKAAESLVRVRKQHRDSDPEGYRLIDEALLALDAAVEAKAR